MRYPDVDVVIPTYKPQKTLHLLLQRLTEQTVPPRHILIINTEEKYFDPALVRDIPHVEVFHIPARNFDHAATRNMGAGLSNAPFLLFMTQDAMPHHAELIENLLHAFADPEVKVAYARQIPRTNATVLEGFARSFNYPPESIVKTQADVKRLGIKTYFCSNVCALYDAEVLKEMDCFSAPCIFNEDMIYAGRVMAQGGAVAYVADAEVAHSHHYTKRQQFQRNFDNGVSQAMHPEIFRGIKAEGEGKRFVKETAAKLRAKKLGHLVPVLYWESACKYLGFRLGKQYRRLPHWLVMACTSNKGFWSYRGPGDTIV